MRQISAQLVNVVHFLDLMTLREIQVSEVHSAGQRWAIHLHERFHRPLTEQSASAFRQTAKSFLRFHESLEMVHETPLSFATTLSAYREHLVNTKASGTTVIYLRWATHFLIHLENSRIALSTASLSDVDRFLDEKRTAGATPHTLAAACQSVKAFLIFAEDQEWSRPKLAANVRRVISRKPGRPRSGPRWRDVRKLLNGARGLDAPSLRARAMLFLFAIYALRIVEVASLRLSDVNWTDETLTIRRAKNHRVQIFPLQYEVAEVLRAYLTGGRPSCSSPLFFVTLSTPYRQLNIASVSNLVRKRMEKLEINAALKTPHGLRHACATQLLHKGFSLSEIADFLGHRTLDTVSTYVKCSPQSLKQVAAFSLECLI